LADFLAALLDCLAGGDAAFAYEVKEEVLVFLGEGFYCFDRGLEGAGFVRGGGEWKNS
jgi:hypothetical protein